MTTIQIQWNDVTEESSNAVIWYEVSYPGHGHETGKMITKTYVEHHGAHPLIRYHRLVTSPHLAF